MRPEDNKRQVLSQILPEYTDWIGNLSWTLWKIIRPKVEEHNRYYKNRKKMYFFNNLVIFEQDGLFLYVDAGFAG